MPRIDIRPLLNKNRRMSMANGPDDRLRIQLLHSPASLHLAGSDGGWSSARSRRFQDSATVHLGFLRCNRPISRKARLPLLNIISEYGTTDQIVRTTLDFFRSFSPRSGGVEDKKRCLSVLFHIFLFFLFFFFFFNFLVSLFFCAFLSLVYPVLARPFLLFVSCRASFRKFSEPKSPFRRIDHI